MNESVAKSKIEVLLARAEGLIPAEILPDLKPMDMTQKAPGWHPFEHQLWEIGEDIRRIMNSATSLRKDSMIYARLNGIAKDRRAKRGRQSFVLLFCYRPCAKWAPSIAGLVDDPEVDGHAIAALYKMKATGYSDVVKPFINDTRTWMRKEAKRYIEFDQWHRIG